MIKCNYFFYNIQFSYFYQHVKELFLNPNYFLSFLPIYELNIIFAKTKQTYF